MHARSRNQIRAVQRRMHELIAVAAAGAAKRARIKCAFTRESQQRPHVDADQVTGSNADHGSQRAVDAQYFVGLIVNHNEVGDGVKDFQPVAVGLFDPGKQAGIFQSHGGVASNGFEQVAIFRRQRACKSGEAEQTSECPIGTGETHRHAVGPAQIRGQPRTEQFGGGASDDRRGVLGYQLGKGALETLLQCAKFAGWSCDKS